MSRNIWGGIAIACLVVFAALIIPRVQNLVVSAGIHDAASLPEHIGICGRDWRLGVHQHPMNLTRIRAQQGVEPIVVDPGPFATCPPGPCTRVATIGPCHTVIFVRVGDDAYVNYELQGGP